MQFSRYIALPKTNLFYQKWFLAIRVILLIAIGVYLWQSVLTDRQILVALSDIDIDWALKNVLLLTMCMILLPINWLLEALKWQEIARNSSINLKLALKGVILGLTLDNIMPAGTGAISGRVMTFTGNRVQVIPGILAGQITQSVVTFAFGLNGLWLVWLKAADLFHWQWEHTLLVAGVILVVGMALINWRGKLVKFISPLQQYQGQSWLIIFSYSLIRYLVFLWQFVLLAKVFAIGIDTPLVIGCATWVFAARTFMPKISNIERLGIRAAAVIFFMGLYHQPSEGILMVVLALWFINIAIPSVLGLVLLRNTSLNLP